MRYEPTPAEQEALLQPVPTHQQPPARYQQLSVDSTPQTTYRPVRSPFVCAGCQDAIFPGLGEKLGAIVPRRKAITGYLSGFLFALGWWFFIDGAVYNSVHLKEGNQMIPLSGEDWIPGILSTFALILVNLIDRESLGADDLAYDGNNVAMKARAFAFFGITVALGSLGGALAILSLKYIIPGLSGDAMYLGQAITIQNVLIFVSSMTLWFGRNHVDEGQIAL